MMLLKGYDKPLHVLSKRKALKQRYSFSTSTIYYRHASAYLPTAPPPGRTRVVTHSNHLMETHLIQITFFQTLHHLLDGNAAIVYMKEKYSFFIFFFQVDNIEITHYIVYTQGLLNRIIQFYLDFFHRLC